MILKPIAHPVVGLADDGGEVGPLQRLLEHHLSVSPDLEGSFTDEQREMLRPLADRLGIDAGATVIAVLPGSRVAEIERLAEPFIGAVKRYSEHVDQLTLVAPMVNDAIRDCFSQKQKQLAPALDWRLLDGQAGLAMEAADLVLTASGTATLQALLYKRPMVVGYKLNPLTYKLLTFFRRIRIPYVAMANLLADEGVDLAICARNQEEVDGAVAELGAKGVKVTGAVVDVADDHEDALLSHAPLDSRIRSLQGYELDMQDGMQLDVGQELEVRVLRFDRERSHIGGIPVDLREPLYRIFLEHAEGAEGLEVGEEPPQDVVGVADRRVVGRPEVLQGLGGEGLLAAVHRRRR